MSNAAMKDFEKMRLIVHKVTCDHEKLMSENAYLKAENEKLKQIISDQFDPDKYVEVYNKMMAEESKKYEEGYEPHENI